MDYYTKPRQQIELDFSKSARDYSWDELKSIISIGLSGVLKTRRNEETLKDDFGIDAYTTSGPSQFEAFTVDLSKFDIYAFVTAINSGYIETCFDLEFVDKSKPSVVPTKKIEPQPFSIHPLLCSCCNTPLDATHIHNGIVRCSVCNTDNYIAGLPEEVSR